jgi:hypothetical protein
LLSHWSTAFTAVVAVLVGSAGCSAGETRSDSETFPLPGDTLRIEASEATVRIETGSTDSLVVERTLTGSAGNDGNATRSFEGGTLRLAVECSGFVTSCEGDHIVRVPEGTAVVVEASGSAVDILSVSGDLEASVTNDGSLRVVGSTGRLQLFGGGGSIVVSDARSSVVTARTSADGDVELGFAAPPERVEVEASGSADITVPEGPETYRIEGSGVSGGVSSDAGSKRVITVSAGGPARVTKAG